MASYIPGCSHTTDAPVRGMRMFERTDDTVRFRCAVCFGEFDLLRCAANVANTNRRCFSAALVGFVTCSKHRAIEKLDLVPPR